MAGIPGSPVAGAAPLTAHGARIGGSASGLPPPTAHGAAAGARTQKSRAAVSSDLEKDQDGTLWHAARTSRYCRSTNEERFDPQTGERQTDTLIVRASPFMAEQSLSSHQGRKKLLPGASSTN